MTFYARVWVRDDAIFTVNTTTKFLAVDTFNDWADEIVDVEVSGDYEPADVLMGRLSYSGGVVSGSGVTVVNSRPGNPRDVQAELAEERSRMKLTFAQLLIGLVTEEWITEAEGTAWLQGTVPATVNALIQSLPVEQRFIALARAVRPSEVLRLDSLVIAMGSAEGKTATELDDFFRTYSVV